jgi:hypothetical protein
MTPDQSIPFAFEWKTDHSNKIQTAYLNSEGYIITDSYLTQNYGITTDISNLIIKRHTASPDQFGAYMTGDTL